MKTVSSPPTPKSRHVWRPSIPVPHEVALVGGPVKGVDLGQVALERPSHLHVDARQGINFRGDRTHC